MERQPHSARDIFALAEDDEVGHKILASIDAVPGPVPSTILDIAVNQARAARKSPYSHSPADTKADDQDEPPYPRYVPEQ